PVDWDAIEALAIPYGATVIEDAAQGHGARWRERPLGALGRLSVLSFGRGKGWTGGAGGALLWRGDALSPRFSFPEPTPSSEGGVVVRAAGQWALGRPRMYRIPASIPWLGLGETHYRAPAVPRSATAASAAILLATRDDADAEVESRRRTADRLIDRLPTGASAIQPPARGLAGYLRLP